MKKSMFCLIYTYSLLLVLCIYGCSQPQAPLPKPDKSLNLHDTIGSVTKYFLTEATPIRGIGIVSCLAGTGSSECPPEIRNELEKYIRQQMPEAGSVNPRQIIESQDTAVVEITGVIPALSTIDDQFDVILRPLSSTQTTSLEGGCLYTAELKEMNRLSSVEQFARFSKTLALAEGPVYSSQEDTSSPTEWRVLGGGRAKQDSPVRLILNAPDFTTASIIRNRINERFGPKTATCVSSGEITLTFPIEYLDRKGQFLGIVKSLLLGGTPQMQTEYTKTSIEQMLSKADLEQAEMALEGIGKPALDLLASLLTNPDPDIQFHAARCMLNIGDKRSIGTLRSIIQNQKSIYRLDAIRTIGQSASRQDAINILETALNSTDIQIRLIAYENLVRLNSRIISRRDIANGDFSVDSVMCSGPKVIYVYRQGKPKIVLFGAPFRCQEDIFIQSRQSGVTINSLPNDNRISVSRKHPTRPRVIGPLLSSNELSVLIATLGETLGTKSGSSVRPGLSVPYSEIIEILEIMTKQKAVLAEFIAGPEAKLEPIL